MNEYDNTDYELLEENQALRMAYDLLRQQILDCARVDVLMEGPRLKGWNRSALDRLWKRLNI
jgi:hypothetical protein